MRSQNAWPTSSSIVLEVLPAFSIVSPINPAGSGLVRGCVPPKSLNTSAGVESPCTAASLEWKCRTSRSTGFFSSRRDELDAWLEQFREEPREQEPLRVPPAAYPRPPRTRTDARQPVAAEVRKDELPEKSESRAPRPLPPPLGGDEQHKDEWARQLEITRAELDEMSPSKFRKAWDGRNKRLEDGGVFEYLTELTEAHSWPVIEKMTAGELIRAVADLGLTPSASQSAQIAGTDPLLVGD